MREPASCDFYELGAQFEIVFRDGSGMMLFVDPENPTKFIQKVSGKAPSFELVEQYGKLVQLLEDEGL